MKHHGKHFYLNVPVQMAIALSEKLEGQRLMQRVINLGKAFTVKKAPFLKHGTINEG